MNTIQKSNPKSFFLRFHQNSKLGDQLLENRNPVLKDSNDNKVSIVILQIMHIGEGLLIAECVDKDYYINK